MLPAGSFFASKPDLIAFDNGFTMQMNYEMAALQQIEPLKRYFRDR